MLDRHYFETHVGKRSLVLEVFLLTHERGLVDLGDTSIEHARGISDAGGIFHEKKILLVLCHVFL